MRRHSIESDDSVSTRTGEVSFARHRTWFQVTGEDEAVAGRTPVVVLHGGPGLAHNACGGMAALARDGRVVVHYDQLGCGKSTHLPDVDPTFWTVQLFMDELSTLVRELGIADRYHLVGHSWGGMLGAEYALTHPAGLASLTICNSPASMELWMKAADELLEGLPRDVRDTLRHHEAAGTTDSPEYQEATGVVYSKHFCRVVPPPPEVTASLTQMEADPTVYHAMNGPSEFHVVGSLKSWSVVDRLPGIDVPTLVVAGRYDEATPETWAPFMELVPDVRSHVFPDSSHTPHIEEPEAWLTVVGAFLRDHDRPAGGTAADTAPGTTTRSAARTTDSTAIPHPAAATEGS